MAKSGLLGGGNGGGLGALPIFAEKSPVFSNPGSVFRRGEGGILPERGSRAQLDIVTQLLASGMQGAQQSGSPLLAFLAPMVGGAVGARTGGLYKGAQKGRDQSAIDQILGTMGGTTPAATISSRSAPAAAGGGAAPNLADLMYPIGEEGPAPAGNIDPASGLDMGSEVPQAKGNWVVEGLTQRGMPQHIAEGFAMNFQDESNFNTAAVGDNGNAFGVAQWNGPRKRALESYAAAVGRPAHDPNVQLDYLMTELQGPENAAWNKIMQSPDARSAAVNVLNHFERPAETHRARREAAYSQGREIASAVANGDFQTYAGMGQSPQMSQGNMRDLIGLMTNQDVSPQIRDLASTMLGGAMKNTGTMTPQQQIGLATDMLALEKAMQPDTSNQPTFRPADPDEAAAYGATGGQIDTKTGRFYPSSTGNAANGEAAGQRQQNEATTIIGKALENMMTTQGLTRDEAMDQIARDPIYGPQLQILGINPADVARRAAAAKAESDREAASPGPGLWSRLFGGGDETSVPPPVAPSEIDPLGIR